MATPTNVSARTTAVSVSRAGTSSHRTRAETTPVTKSATNKRYANVKSKIDTGRSKRTAPKERDEALRSVANKIKL